MAYSTQYLLKAGVMDVMSGNRINGVMGNTIIVTPDMFVSGSGVNCVDFVASSCGVYNQVNCTGYRVDSGHISITAGTSSNYFSFTLTNLGSDPVINGYALVALMSPLSISYIKGVLGESTYSLKNLCQSPLINATSAIKPTGAAPYSIGQFVGYCHLAAGGVNLYAPNAVTIGYGNSYTFYAAATKNQVNYSQLKIEIFLNGTSLGSTTGATASNYLEYTTSTYINNTYSTTTTGTVQSVVSYWTGTAWSVLTSTSQTATFTGNPFVPTLMSLTIGTLISKLTYSISINNQTGSGQSVWWEIQNTTQGSSMIQSGTTSTAPTGTNTVGGIITLDKSNYTGDSFIMNYSIDGKTTWHSVYCADPQTLPYNGLL